MSDISRARFIAGAGATAALVAAPQRTRAANPARIGVDYAYYNPPSLILKQSGRLDAALAKHGVGVDWVLSLGSNKANSYLAANAVQFGSTAGSAALLARTNGTPIKTVLLFSQPEWTALVVGKSSPIASVAALRGKRVAATRGTDPWFFLLRALKDVNLTQHDIELVDLQHPDGRIALERGQVDAWAGLDPHMAAAQVEDGAKLLYRNVEYNTYGALNAREDFVHDHPDLVTIVLQEYARARDDARSRPADAVKILADAAKISETVAGIEVRDRTRYPDPVPAGAYRTALTAVAGIVKSESLAAPGSDVDAAVTALIDAGPARRALGHG